MKKSYVNRSLFMVACIALGMVSFASFSNATTFSFLWKDVNSSGVVTVRVNDDNLDSSYNGSTFTGGIALWNDSAADVNIIDSDYSSATVDYHSVTEATWTDNGWGNGSGWTQPYRDNGTACVTLPIAQDPDTLCGGKLVNYAAIYMNKGNVVSSSKRKAAVAHELGHAMGLAHTEFITEKSNSLMTQALAGGLKPSTYDVNEINNKY